MKSFKAIKSSYIFNINQPESLFDVHNPESKFT